MKNKKNIIILVVSLILVLIVCLILILNKNKISNKPVKEPEEKKYEQCYKDASENEILKSNWKHNELNYYVDENNNRVNNSELLSKAHNLENGIVISNMSIISENCNETKANVKFNFTNNTGHDINIGSLHLYFKPQQNAEEIHVSLDVMDIKNGETKEIDTSYKFRVIDALDYTAKYIDMSEFDG